MGTEFFIWAKDCKKLFTELVLYNTVHIYTAAPRTYVMKWAFLLQLLIEIWSSSLTMQEFIFRKPGLWEFHSRMFWWAKYFSACNCRIWQNTFLEPAFSNGSFIWLLSNFKLSFWVLHHMHSPLFIKWTSSFGKINSYSVFHLNQRLQRIITWAVYMQCSTQQCTYLDLISYFRINHGFWQFEYVIMCSVFIIECKVLL